MVESPESSTSEPARRFLAQVAAQSTEEPGVADGVLGPNPDGPSWLAARARPDKPLSPSGIDYFLNCPRQFFWSQIAGLYMEEDPSVGAELPATTWGTVVHDAIEGCWGRLRGVPADARTQIFREEIVRQAQRQLPFLGVDSPAILDRIARQADTFVGFVDGFGDGALWSAEQPQFEVLLEGKIAGITLKGFADLVWPDRIVDVKTGQNLARLSISEDGRTLLVAGKKGQHVAGNRHVRKALQVGLYVGMAGAGRSACERLSGEYWHIKPERENRIQLEMPTGPVAEEDWRFQALARVRAGFDLGVFPAVGDPVDSWNDTCNYCNYKSLCGGGTAERWAEIRMSPVVQPVLFQESPPPEDSGRAEA